MMGRVCGAEQLAPGKLGRRGRGRKPVLRAFTFLSFIPFVPSLEREGQSSPEASAQTCRATLCKSHRCSLNQSCWQDEPPQTPTSDLRNSTRLVSGSSRHKSAVLFCRGADCACGARCLDRLPSAPSAFSGIAGENPAQLLPCAWVHLPTSYPFCFLFSATLLFVLVTDVCFIHCSVIPVRISEGGMSTHGFKLWLLDW